MYEVKNDFIDKFTKKKYVKGDSYSHKDEKRIAFLIEKDFLKQPKENKKKRGE